MKAIYIPELLKLPEQKEVIEINEYLSGLETLNPVGGSLQVKHQGNYLAVSAQASTIITLVCDRCLQQYNHRLAVDTSELIWLDESAQKLAPAPLEQEMTWEDLVEILPAQGYFEPDTWLYEQLCLEIPPRQLCSNQCRGITIADGSSESPRDGRWDALEALKRQLSG
ncbi:MAG: DUF177 domain-containing protein [Symploca sp. SIO3C6]|uniref:DUF177 domain-containing protein n=1 Tax=Symploca sp. SIO1C4 TaxID=2607765 RepID=A0A6B3NCN6_9CYAN|nr:DUF177 domain-containing protein [Symploca sp. SIO3C6]NER29427.1 DUF177 domain-containing protein [Symploca sp. SIO1C4]